MEKTNTTFCTWPKWLIHWSWTQYIQYCMYIQYCIPIPTFPPQSAWITWQKFLANFTFPKQRFYLQHKLGKWTNQPKLCTWHYMLSDCNTISNGHVDWYPTQSIHTSFLCKYKKTDTISDNTICQIPVISYFNDDNMFLRFPPDINFHDMYSPTKSLPTWFHPLQSTNTKTIPDHLEEFLQTRYITITCIGDVNYKQITYGRKIDSNETVIIKCKGMLQPANNPSTHRGS